MKNREKYIKKLALSMYALKIAWAELQDPKTKVNYKDMEDEIKISWYSYDCPYCVDYIETIIELEECINCPLYVAKKRNLNNTKHCCNGIWYKMDKAKTWKEWIKYAKKMVIYIEENG